MQDTDAVSCILCLQADEYGSMIKVCVPPGAIPPSMEKVICRRCAQVIMRAANEEPVEVIDGRANVDNDHGLGSGPDPGDATASGDAWDSGLPERAVESVVETDQSEPGNPPGSRTKRSPRRVASEKTDE